MRRRDRALAKCVEPRQVNARNAITQRSPSDSPAQRAQFRCPGGALPIDRYRSDPDSWHRTEFGVATDCGVRNRSQSLAFGQALYIVADAVAGEQNIWR